MDTCFYFDGKSATAQQCTVNVANECVYIYLNNDNNRLIIWNKNQLTDINLTQHSLVIKYGAFPHESLECKGAQVHTLFKEVSAKNLTTSVVTTWYTYKVATLVTLCVLFIGMCGFGYFFALPWVGEKAASFISKDVEVSLGEQIASGIIKTNTKKDSASYYANRFVSKLQTNTSYSIQVTIIESDEINAFALPGGNIFIYSGLIKKMDNYQQFAALLGHETSHVIYQHSLKSICRSTASSFFIASLFGDVTGISSGIIEQADQFKQLNYSRELETQADVEGYNLMITNHISPQGMTDLLSLLQKETQDTPSLMKYFSTHPETEARIQNIKKMQNQELVFEEDTVLKQLFLDIKVNLN